MTNIGTKLHKARESSPNHQVLLQMQLYPHFVFDKELISLFDTKDAQNTVRLMLDYDAAFLPYPDMTVEVWSGNDWRYLWIITNGKDGSDSFEILGVEYVDGATLPQTLQAAVKYNKDPSKVIVYNEEAGRQDVYEPIDPIVAGMPAWDIKWYDEFKSREWPGGREDMLMHGLAALNCALLVGHMAELDREEITPQAVAALNKSRARTRKPAIHAHTVVRIGHYYDRDGKRHKVGSGSGGERGPVKMHMRAAHTRRQQHGKQWMEDNPIEAAKPWNTDTYHTVIIPAVIVNYSDGSALARPLPKVVRV